MSLFITLVVSLIASLNAQDGLGTTVKECSGCVDASGICFTDKTYALCKTDPCLTDNGGCLPEQQCIADYCGGCFAACGDLPDACATIRCASGTRCCLDASGEVSCCECESLGLCTDSSGSCNREVSCLDLGLVEPCTVNNGGCKDTQTCVPDYCGGCGVICEDCVKKTDSECFCTEQYDPVCCDGTTYSNQCFADCECPTSCTDGACSTKTTDTPATTGCKGKIDCSCTKEDIKPVCCDGTTYSNQCFADCVCPTSCTDGACVDTTDTPATTGCTKLEDSKCFCTEQYDPVCCDGTTYSNKCAAYCKCATECEEGECSDTKTTEATKATEEETTTAAEETKATEEETTTATEATAEESTTTRAVVGCTEDARLCSDSTVLVRSPELDCDWYCPDTGCADTVCCDGEPMTECEAINECEADDGFTDPPDGCTDDVFPCPDGETFISRNECCVFDKDECEGNDGYCDVRKVNSKLATFKEVSDTNANTDEDKMAAYMRCKFCLCSEVGQEFCNEVYQFDTWTEGFPAREMFTKYCLANVDLYPALEPANGTICEWEDIRVKDTEDLDGCDCSAFFCKAGPNYDGTGFLMPGSGANKYGVMVAIGCVMAMFCWM